MDKGQNKTTIKKISKKYIYINFFFINFCIYSWESKNRLFKWNKKYYATTKIYNSFFNYFEKYWKNSYYFDFEDCDKKDMIERTDNICENFHNNFNKLINNPYSKIFFWLIKLNTD